MQSTDRRVRRTQKSLHEAVISLLLEKNYDELTVQEILDRANVGRSTFYTHFDDKDQLLLHGVDELHLTLDSALQRDRAKMKPHERVIGFSRAMFEHAHNYRNVYQALLYTQGWPRVRQRIESVLEGLIRRESKAEIERLRSAKSEVPVDLFVFYLTATFFAVMTWWIDRRSRLTPAQIDEVYRSLVLPTIHAVLA